MSRMRCTGSLRARCGYRRTGSPTASCCGPAVKFHDGSELTAHDVAFSLQVLKEKGHPIAQQLLRDFAGAQALDDATVVVRVSRPIARATCRCSSRRCPIFSRAYYSSRPFDETTLDVPLGSGPYKVGRFEPGRYIEYDRVKDWWGADLPVSRGQHNFDAVRYEYYRDRDVAFEGFTGKSYLFREEFTSRIWATRYDFPALRDGRVKRDIIPDQTPSGAQGWFINTRREKFKDKRLREALIYAFDFEWTNKSHDVRVLRAYPFRVPELRHDGGRASRARTSSRCSSRSAARLPRRCSAIPSCRRSPTDPGQDRALLRKASALLQEAGFIVKDGKRVTPQGRAHHASSSCSTSRRSSRTT